MKVLESLIRGQPHRKGRQLCCLVAHTQHNCVSFCVDASWYENDPCHSGPHLLMHMASGTETDPVPSFFIACQVLGKSIFPLWLAEFTTEAAHALLPVWMPPFYFVRGGWQMLQALLCAVFAELWGLWTQQSAMHPGLLYATYLYRGPDHSLLLCFEGDMHFSLKTYYP